MNVLEIDGLRKIYKSRTHALTGLALEVKEGALMGFLGPNGAGKSTTINILAGLLKPESGEIRFFGKSVTKSDYRYKRNAGFVLDQPVYIEKLTAKEYLTFVGMMYRLERQEIEERSNDLIEFFELEDKGRDFIETYSAGMKKKLSLAAAVIHRPKLLILDEPLEGTDPVAARQIKDMLGEMSRGGTSILLSSHNLDTVEKLCDEVAIINKGKLVFQSRTEDIRKKIKDEVSQETYQSLEEIFIDVVSKDGEQKEKKKLSWL